MEAHCRLRPRKNQSDCGSGDYDDGTIYCLAEYYQPGLTPSQHIDNLGRLPGFVEASRIVADPSIFYKNRAQADGDFKSIADIYREAGLSGMWEGENGEIAGMERIFEHRRNLDGTLNDTPTIISV